MKLSSKKIAGTIRGRMSRKQYWSKRKELRAQYKKQLLNLERESHQNG